VVAIGGNGELFVAECKWGRITGAHLRTLRTRASLVAAEAGSIVRIHLALFTSRHEVDDEIRREVDSGAILLFTSDDLR
jgi:hypothetical protein